MHDLNEAIKEIFKNSGWLGLFGGISHYLYQISNGEQFFIRKLLITMFLAFWVSNTIGDFIPLGTAYRDGILGISGFVALPLLALLEKKGPQWLFNKITK